MTGGWVGIFEKILKRGRGDGSNKTGDRQLLEIL